MTILRERHPFEGRSLRLMGTLKRRGTPLLLVALPDGSRSLIPASWTDWKTTNDQPSPPRPQRREPCLAPLTDLLHLRVIVDALLGRSMIRQEPAADEESHHAMDPGISRTSPPAQKTLGGELDAKARVEALSILARVIAQSFKSTKQMDPTDE